MTRRIAVGAAAIVGLLALWAGPVLADHGGGHNGETIELSKSDDLVDGEIVTVTITSFLPGNTVNLVTCYVFPALGPADCNLANFGQHSSEIAADGTASIDYKVDLIEGSCDQDNPCFIVAADGFGTDANYAAQPITFAAVEASDDDTMDDSTDETVDDSNVEAEVADEGEDTADEEVEDDTADVADEGEDTTDASDEDVVAEEAAEDTTDEAAVDEDDDESNGGLGWLVPLIIALVVLGGGGAFVASRNSKSAA